MLKRIARATLPISIQNRLRTIRARLRARRDATRDPAAVFADIYRQNRWGGEEGEVYSGPGSRGALASDYVQFVADYVIANQIRSILDIGVGDFHVARALLQTLARRGWQIEYTGCDIVPAIVAAHNKTHSAPNIRFLCLDAIADTLPVADLCLVRQVMQHLSNAAIDKMLTKIDAFPHAIITEHHPAPQNLASINIDKPNGGDIRVSSGSGVFPQFAPFNGNYEVALILPFAAGLIIDGETDTARQERLVVFVKQPHVKTGFAAMTQTLPPDSVSRVV